MPLFRCLNCKKEFEAIQPACVDCGIDPTTHPRHKDMVVPLVTIHFDPPSGVPGIGKGFAACNPKLRVGMPNCGFSGEKNGEKIIITCPKCLASELYANAGEAGISLAMGQLKLEPTTGGV